MASTGMSGDLCLRCMRYHGAPVCNHDSTAPCVKCGLSKGFLVEGMTGTVCWFCHAGACRSSPTPPPEDPPRQSASRMVGFLVKDGDGITAEITTDAGFVYALTGVSAERDGRRGYAVEMRVVRVPEWAMLPGIDL